MCLSAVLLAEWNWSGGKVLLPVLGQLGEQCISSMSSSSMAAAAVGSPDKSPWVEEEYKWYNPLFQSHSGLLNAAIGSVSPTVALLCILLLFHLQFLPTYFKNM